MKARQMSCRTPRRGDTESIMSPSPDLDPQKEQREHDLTMHIFAMSAGLVGVCLTAIGLLRVLVSRSRVETIGEELLAGNALCFMVSCLLSFWSFKTPRPRLRAMLRKIIDGLFLLALTFMVAVCILVAYAVI